jgi:hypothetical protein
MIKESVFVPFKVTEFFTSKVGKEFNIFVFKMRSIFYKI